MQCIFTKKGKNDQNKIFLELSLSYFTNRSKINFKYANYEDPMARFWEIGGNIDFWPKIAIFIKKGSNLQKCDLSSKIQKGQKLGSPNFVPNF